MPVPQIDDSQVDAWKIYLKNTPVSKINNLEETFFIAIKNQQKQLSTLILDYIDPHFISPQKQTPLHACCLIGNFDLAKKLIDQDASLYIPNVVGQSPIDMLFLNPVMNDEHKKILSYLLTEKKVLWGIAKNKADAPIYNVLHTEFFSPMFKQMTDKKKQELIKINNLNENLLIQLSRTSNTTAFLEVIEYIKEKGINLNNIVLEPKHSNLLIETSKVSNASFVKAIFDLNQFNIEQCNDDGETPLFISLINGNLAVSQFLLDSGAKLFVKNFEKKTPEDLISYISRHTPDLHDQIKSFIESNKEKITLELSIRDNPTGGDLVETSSANGVVEKKKRKKKALL